MTRVLAQYVSFVQRQHKSRLMKAYGVEIQNKIIARHGDEVRELLLSKDEKSENKDQALDYLESLVARYGYHFSLSLSLYIYIYIYHLSYAPIWDIRAITDTLCTSVNVSVEQTFTYNIACIVFMLYLYIYIRADANRKGSEPPLNARERALEASELKKQRLASMTKEEKEQEKEKEKERSARPEKPSDRRSKRATVCITEEQKEERIRKLLLAKIKELHIEALFSISFSLYIYIYHLLTLTYLLSSGVSQNNSKINIPYVR